MEGTVGSKHEVQATLSHVNADKPLLAQVKPGIFIDEQGWVASFPCPQRNALPLLANSTT